MAPIPIPSAGFSLPEFPTDTAFQKSKGRQAIKIVSAGNESLEQMISNMRHGSADISVSLGKKPVCVLLVSTKSVGHELICDKNRYFSLTRKPIPSERYISHKLCFSELEGRKRLPSSNFLLELI